MRGKLVKLSVFFLVCCGSLSGQCPASDFILKTIAYVCDSSKLSPNEQINLLTPYEQKIVVCSFHDSSHVRLLQRIGKLFYSLSEFSKAIRYYERSIDLINENATKHTINIEDLVEAYYRLYTCNDSLQRVTEKMKNLDSAASIAIRLKIVNNFSLWAIYRKAEYSFDVGDYHRCIDYAKLCEAVAMASAAKGSKQDYNFAMYYANSSLLNIINALILLKQYDEAQRLLEIKATESLKNKQEGNLGFIYGTLAEILELKGDFEKVMVYQNKALEVEKRSGNAVNYKAILNDMGYEVWFKHYKKPDEALKYYQQALNFKVTNNPYPVLNSLESLRILNRIANVYAVKGEYNDALRYIQVAFDQLKPGTSEVEVLHSPLEEFIRQRRVGYIATLIQDKAVILHQKYRVTGYLEDIKEAVRIYKVADQFLEKIKAEQSDVKSKLFWRSDRRHLYEQAIEACYAYSNYTDAFYFFERSRAVLLNDELKDLHLMNNADLVKQEQLKRGVAHLEKQLLKENKSSDRSRQLQEELMKERQELELLIRQITARNPLYVQNFLESDFISFDNVRRSLLNRGEKLVEFFDGDSASYSIIISQEKVSLQKMNKDTFTDLVNRFVAYVSDYSRLNTDFTAFKDVSYKLYELIFGGNDIFPGKIIISPDKLYFPAEALITNKKESTTYLIETHPVSYAHSAQLLMIDFNSNATTDVKDFLGLAPVNFRNHIPSLIGSDASLEKVTSALRDSKTLTFTNASKNNFTQQFPFYSIVQLYTHASDNKKAGEPEVYFADSILYLSELINERKPSTKLIVLSACETATGNWQRGEGVYSFNRGFASLGIPSTITNLWSVDNVSTYRLTELFYKHLAQNESIDVALQNAKLEFIKSSSKEKSLPYFWAATILSGKTDAIKFKQQYISKSLYWSVGLGCCFLLLGYLFWNARQQTKRLSLERITTSAVHSNQE